MCTVATTRTSRVGRTRPDRFATALERVGPDVMEKFFVKNAELLMP